MSENQFAILGRATRNKTTWSVLRRTSQHRGRIQPCQTTGLLPVLPTPETPTPAGRYEPSGPRVLLAHSPIRMVRTRSFPGPAQSMIAVGTRSKDGGVRLRPDTDERRSRESPPISTNARDDDMKIGRATPAGLRRGQLRESKEGSGRKTPGGEPAPSRCAFASARNRTHARQICCGMT